MANPEHLEILEQGVEVWNRWRGEHLDAHVDLSEVILRNSDLCEANLDAAALAWTDLSRAGLSRASVSRADLTGANLTGADLADAKLTSARLFEANLSGASLGGANLRAANLGWADLSEAYLGGANLGGANLGTANLAGANLTGAELRGANLGWANLTEADLSEAKLRETNLGGAILNGTRLVNTSLRATRGLETVQHAGPCPLSTRTLQLSHGQIPDIFLRGCGLQGWEIASKRLYDPALSSASLSDLLSEIYRLRAEGPIRPDKLFISYTHRDSLFVDALAQKLEGRGIRYWRDIHDLTSGRLETQIARAIRLSSVVLLVLSEESVDSDWVQWEAKTARDLERDLRAKATPKDVLLPVALDDSWKTCDWPSWLRHQIEQYNVLQFEGWQDSAVMDRQFEKVVAGLPLYGPKVDAVELAR